MGLDLRDFCKFFETTKEGGSITTGSINRGGDIDTRINGVVINVKYGNLVVPPRPRFGVEFRRLWTVR